MPDGFWGRVIAYTYDALNRVITITDELNGQTIMAYEAAENAIAKTDAEGHTTRFTYDALNQIVTVTDALSQSVVTDALGYTSRMEYDAADNKIATIDPLDQITRYGYDALDRQVVMTDALNGLTSARIRLKGSTPEWRTPKRNPI